MNPVPRALACRILGALLEFRARRLEERAQGGRRGRAPHAAGQRTKAQEARQAAGRMFALADQLKGGIDPDALGDLCALAMEHAAAYQDLLEAMEEARHPRFYEVQGLRPWQFLAIAEAALGGWPQEEEHA